MYSFMCVYRPTLERVVIVSIKLSELLHTIDTIIHCVLIIEF